MKTQEPRTVHLKDYKPPLYRIESAELDVQFDPSATQVSSRLHIQPASPQQKSTAPLVLDGEKLEIVRVAIDGRPLEDGAFTVSEKALTIAAPPRGPFLLEISTLCDPQANKALTGLYRSGTLYCTQCEPEGFRRITYYLDRPDVLAKFRVRLEADLKDVPVLLANGNLVEEGKVGARRHYAIWEDPHPKPSYLFAMVGGKLGCVKGSFTTRSGRKVELRVYCEPGLEDRCDWAMESLKTCMRWDEERFGLEYDLDIFMIVAVSNFNMGAMENKGLNIFNDKLVLARPDTATDADYEAIEAVIAHEYFHNWTGNRVTCRDWFQLCLKEGLTVFRDQEFTSDLRSGSVKRIADVRFLRAYQFAEDGGPLAHPVRPESFIEINNFYTRTVYEKGAELCRMIMTLVGRDGFRKGLDLYFERHDGTAATVEDFVAAMSDATGADLGHFMLWYGQAGTPDLSCRLSYSGETKTAKLTVKQSQKPTPGQPKKKPLHIPVRIGLLDGAGKDLPLKLAGGNAVADGVLHLTKRSESFVFPGIAERPVLSALRGFSAPVKLSTNLSDRELEFLIAHDSDLFNRWQAAQSLAMKSLVAMTAAARSGAKPRPSPRYGKALAKLISDERLEPAFRAEMLVLPSEHAIAMTIGADLDPQAIYTARHAFRQSLGRALKTELQAVYDDNAIEGAYKPDPESVGRRALRNAALSLLTIAGGRAALGRLREHYKTAGNMTDSMAALRLFTELEGTARQSALDAFYRRWKKDALVLDKWFAVQAVAPAPGTIERVRELLKHPQFDMTNPNRVRSVMGAFSGNLVHFNDPSGAGYKLVSDAVLQLNAFNPLMAARLLSAFETWRMLEPVRRGRAKDALERVRGAENLSRDVFEIVGKMLSEPEIAGKA